MSLIFFFRLSFGEGEIKKKIEWLSRAAGFVCFAELSRAQSYPSHTTGTSYRKEIYYLESTMYTQHTCREYPASENILLIAAVGLSKSVQHLNTTEYMFASNSTIHRCVYMLPYHFFS